MYALLDTKKTNELFLLRQGWFSREYELTDNVNSYGKIVYQSLLQRNAVADSATGTWIFKRGDIFGRTITISDQNGELIGKASRDWFERRTILTLQTGFQAEFYKPSIWSREYVWDSAGFGKVMHIKSYPLTLKTAIYIDQSMTPASLIPLITFLGSYLVVLRRRRKAAH